MNHTPRPWKVEPFPYHGEPTDSGEYVIQTDYGPIATIDVAGRPHSEMQANALLFAAAPDLLEALQSIADAQSVPSAFRHIARNAIAKATGEQP